MRVSKLYLALLAIHLAATGTLFSSLPMEVPLVWTLSGDPDVFVPRPALLFVAAIPLFAYVFLGLQPRVDARSTYAETQHNIYLWGARSFLTLFLYLYWTNLAFALGVSSTVLVAVKGGVGMFLIVLGSFLYRTPYRSRWIWAIRTDWAAQSEANWKRLHRIAGWLLVLLGLCTLLLIFVPRGADALLFLFLLVGYVASYLWLSYRSRNEG